METTDCDFPWVPHNYHATIEYEFEKKNTYS